eukprot:TRINITY_DN14343_c0_g2_i2.p1 TRINITY_DN14343_c0_g2~~TRINITY_DN14343_c0_g2_i2.p1  ORF type:complete len:469 (-),score=82.76 TRINITY_DN14343_c0_g2_i2:431-1837(-)
MFQGGPLPVNPLVRPVSDEDRSNPCFKTPSPDKDQDWLQLVECGGAGDHPDTAEQQLSRYRTEALKSPESNPDLLELQLSRPDILITCSVDYVIKTWDVNDDFKLLQEFEGHLNFVNTAVPCRGDKILSCSDDFTCRLWAIGKAGSPGELLKTYWICEYPVKTVCELPGQRAACGGLDKTLRIFSLVTGDVLHRIRDHREIGPDDGYFQKQGCGALWTVLHLRGNVLASGCDDGTVRVWDIDTGKCLDMKRGHSGWGEDIGKAGVGWKLSERYAGVWRLCHLGKDGKQFASCSYDRTICIWDSSDLDNINVIRMWKAAENSVLSVNLIDPCHMASCGSDKEIKIWNFETGELVASIETRGIASSIVPVDDSVIAIAGGDATVRVYDWKHGQDLMGKHGFYAHDMSLTFASSYRYADKVQRNWTTKPIMYSSLKWPDCEADSKDSREKMSQVVKNALRYPEDTLTHGPE